MSYTSFPGRRANPAHLPSWLRWSGRIFDWYVNGEEQPDGSLRPLGSFTIAKRLDARRSPPSGGKWPACTVQAILA